VLSRASVREPIKSEDASELRDRGDESQDWKDLKHA
jgi:hypothetical protein